MLSDEDRRAWSEVLRAAMVTEVAPALKVGLHALYIREHRSLPAALSRVLHAISALGVLPVLDPCIFSPLQFCQFLPSRQLRSASPPLATETA